MATHLVSCIDVRDFGSEMVHVGDLNGDGAPDLLFVQSIHATREITCLTATDIRGEMLWQVGVPSADNGRLYSDLPVQIHDWDDDGANEVLYVSQAGYDEPYCAGGWARERAGRYVGVATMHVLDAATGREKHSFPLPAPADDSFLFADLTGRGRRADLVVKDRYWTMWGVSHEGQVLWEWSGSPGHFPAIGDFDGDGCDEVFVGFALIDQDGREMFAHDPAGAHQDAAYVVRLASGEWRLLFGNHGLHCLDVSGRELWGKPLAEAQHVVAGQYRADSEVQFLCIDRGQPRGADRDPAMLYLYDPDGAEIWRRTQPEGSWCAGVVAVHWADPDGLQGGLVYARGPVEPVAVYDGDGDVVDTFSLQLPPERETADLAGDCYVTRADVWGDGREEVILFGSRGCCVYANARAWQPATRYNNTLYPGM